MKPAPARILLALCLLLLAGCARLQPEARSDDALAAGLLRFTVDGKVSWRAPENSGRASVNWIQDPDRSRLVISGPLGAGAALVEEDGDGARLRVGDEERRADDAGALLASALGLPLPVRQARYWVLGTLAPEPGRVVERDEAGRPARILQAGWDVSFARHRSVDGFALPGRVEMRRGDLRLVFVATRWRPQQAEFPGEI